MHLTESQSSLTIAHRSGAPDLYLWAGGTAVPGLADLELGVFPEDVGIYARHRLTADGVVHPDRRILATGVATCGHGNFTLQRIHATASTPYLDAAIEFVRELAEGTPDTTDDVFLDTDAWRKQLLEALQVAAAGEAYLAVDHEDPEHGTYASTIPDNGMIEDSLTGPEDQYRPVSLSKIPAHAVWMDRPDERGVVGTLEA